MNKKLADFWLYSYGNVKDATECQQQYCQQTSKCTAFVYNTKTKECTLKKPPVLLNGLGNLKLLYEEGKVFGPKYCPGMVSKILSLLCFKSENLKTQCINQARKFSGKTVKNPTPVTTVITDIPREGLSGRRGGKGLNDARVSGTFSQTNVSSPRYPKTQFTQKPTQSTTFTTKEIAKFETTALVNISIITSTESFRLDTFKTGNRILDSSSRYKKEERALNTYLIPNQIFELISDC